MTTMRLVKRKEMMEGAKIWNKCTCGVAGSKLQLRIFQLNLANMPDKININDQTQETDKTANFVERNLTVRKSTDTLSTSYKETFYVKMNLNGIL
jgi:hypothetical protein